MRFTAALLDLLFPPRCLGCRRLGSYFCSRCAATVHPLEDPFCPSCSRVVDPAFASCRCAYPPLRYARAAGAFDGPLRDAIHRFKYQGMSAGADALAMLLRPAIAPLAAPDILLVPLPLHPRRLRERGYNQAALLAHALVRDGSLRVEDDALRRVKATRAQVTLGARERARNMAGAFAADPTRCAGQTLLLIDDVCTTGATLRSAAQALRTAGAREVYAAVLAAARGGHDRP
jgi:ComF family protein